MNPTAYDQIPSQQTLCRLTAVDEPAMMALLAQRPGFGLFITHTLVSLGFQSSAEFWGIQQHRDMEVRLLAILVVIGITSSVVALDDCELSLYIPVLLRAKCLFVMGDGPAIDAIGNRLQQSFERVEDHYFVELPTHRFHRQSVPPDFIVRKGTLHDLDVLTSLYHESTGFEGQSLAQVRMNMRTRLTRLRMVVGEFQDEIVAAASTSAQGDKIAMIGGVLTAPWARGRGFAAAVVSALSADLLHDKIRPYLFYLKHNAPAEHIYQKIGFRSIGEWRVGYFYDK